MDDRRQPAPAPAGGSPDEARGPGEFVRRWRGGNLGRLVLVETADLDRDGHPEIIALAGKELKVFDWSGSTYVLRAEALLPRDGLSLAAGDLGAGGPAAVAVGCRDAVLLYTVTHLGLRPLCETLLYPGAYFRSLDLADVNGDGRPEVVAAASGAQTMYIFQVAAGTGGEGRLEELGRVYIGGLVTGQGGPGGELAAGTRDGYVDVFVPCSLLPDPHQTLYSVRRGDSLWRIARRFGVSPGALVRANRLQEPYQLEPGQVLIVPAPPRPGSS